MKYRFLIFVSFFSSLFMPQFLRACAYDGSYYQGHVFSSTLLSDSLYKIYYDLEPYCYDCYDLGPKANLMEWKQKLGTNATLKEIGATVYEQSYEDLQLAYNTSNPKNEFEKSLFKNKDMLEYLLYAKRIEPLCQLEYEEWSAAPQYSPEMQASLTKELEVLTGMISNIQDPWLKQRYVMHLVRMALFGGKFAESIQYYETYGASTFEKNSTYYRTLAYKAGAMRKNKDVLGAKLTFAEVFDKSPDYRHLAYKNYKYIDIEEADWNKLVSMSASPSVKAGLWFMQEVYMGALDLNSVKEIYALDPGSVRLEVAALRQINRMEEALLMPSRLLNTPLDSTRLTYGEEATWEFGNSASPKESWWSRFWKSIVNFFRRLFGMSELSMETGRHVSSIKPASFYYYSDNSEVQSILDSKTLQEANSIFGEIYKNDAVKNKALFQLLHAYTLMYSEEFEKSEALLKELIQSVNQEVRKHAEYLSCLLPLWKNQAVDAEAEENILKYLLTAPKDAYGDDGFRRSLLMAELGRTYLKTNRLDEAALAFNNSQEYQSAANALIDWYYSDGDMEKLSAWKENYTSPLMKELGKQFFTSNEIAEIRAIKLMRRNKFEEANTILQAIPDTFDFSRFNTSFRGSPMRPFAEPMETYTSKSFTAEVVKRLKTGQAKDLMEIGNALSFSNYWCYNGNLWKSGGVLDALRTYDGAVYPFNIPSMAVDFHNRNLAFVKQYCTNVHIEKYYKAAASLSTDQEMKAQALFSAVQQLPSRYVSYSHPNIQTERDSLMKVLKLNLASTKTVQDALISCPDFASYKFD
jgi:hypothetical protein